MKTINLTMTSLFIYFNHPLILTMIILAQTATSCFIMGTHLKNFWIPYILFIIMLSGLMIMFLPMYMCSTTPNQLMKSPLHMLSISMMMMLFSTIMSYYWNNKLTFMSYSTSYHKNNNLFNMLINSPSQLTFMLMMMFLTLSMLTAMKISSTSNKPLRSI